MFCKLLFGITLLIVVLQAIGVEIELEVPFHERVTAWLHIPKVGSSFSNVLLSAMCGGSLNESDRLGRPFPVTFEPIRSRCPVASESCVFKSFDHFPVDRGCNSWTSHTGTFAGMFRHPEERIISGYLDQLHDYQTPNCVVGCTHPWMGHPGGAPMPHIRTYARETEGCQVRMMTGRYCGDAWKPTQGEIDVSISRLDGFAFVGIQEEWYLSVCLFYKMFGGRCHARDLFNTRPSVGSRGKKEELRSSLGQWKDTYDGQLYEQARTRFQADVVKYNVTAYECANICPLT